MSLPLEDALLTVYQQSLLENRKTVLLEEKSFPVRVTAKRKLKQVDFQYEGRDLRGLEQNPETKSRWAAKAMGVSVFTDWPEGQSNAYGEYRTCRASKRTTQRGLLQSTQRPPPRKATV